jgi:glycoside/pentoside/hexuronide:cation symporter, GPH family
VGAVGFAFPVLDVLGFNPGAANEPSVIVALAVIYAGIPTVLKLIAISIAWRHPITLRRQRAIRRVLDRRSAAGTTGVGQ